MKNKKKVATVALGLALGLTSTVFFGSASPSDPTLALAEAITKNIFE